MDFMCDLSYAWFYFRIPWAAGQAGLVGSKSETGKPAKFCSWPGKRVDWTLVVLVKAVSSQ